MSPYYPALSPLAESGRLWLAAHDMARRVPDLARRVEAVALCDRQHAEHAARSFRLINEGDLLNLVAGALLLARGQGADERIAEALDECVNAIDARLCELEAEPEGPGLREEHGLGWPQDLGSLQREAA